MSWPDYTVGEWSSNTVRAATAADVAAGVVVPDGDGGWALKQKPAPAAR